MSIDNPTCALDNALGAEERANERVCSLEDELELARFYKIDAMAALADNERCITAQALRIAELETHLSKCREVAYTLIAATAGVLPMQYAPDAKDTTKTKQTKVKT